MTIDEEAQAIIRDAMRFRFLMKKESSGRSDVHIVVRYWDRPMSESEPLFGKQACEEIDRRIFQEGYT